MTTFRTSNLLLGLYSPPFIASLMISMSAVQRNLCVLTKSLVTDRAAKWAEGIVVGLHPPLFVASSVEDMLAVESDK